MPNVSEQTFEQQFANMAHTVLADKAPALLDYNLGFQTVDKDDEGTRGVGVFGLRIGKELVYVPAIFAQGEVKGIDMMYATGADIFVPLTEDWVNYFLKRKPHVIGNVAERNRRDRGVRSNRLKELFVNLPGGNVFGMGFRKTAREAGVSDQITDFLIEMHNKVASGDWEDWLPGSVGMWLGSDRYIPSTPENLSKIGHAAAIALLNQCKRDPKLAESILETYSPQELAAGLVDEGNRVPHTDTRRGNEQNADPAPLDGSESEEPDGDQDAARPRQPKNTVVILDADDTGLSDEERERLMAGERVVRDSRYDDDVSVVYEISTKHQLANAEGPGIYEVLMGDGSFATTIVAEPKTFGRGRVAGVKMMIQPQRRVATPMWVDDVMVRVGYPADRMRQTWEDVGKDPTKVRVDERVVFLNAKGACSFPCTIKEKSTSTNGNVILWVEPDYYIVEKMHTAWVGNRYTGPSRIPEDRAIATADGREIDDKWRYNAGLYELERGGEDRGNRIVITKDDASDSFRQTESTVVISRDHFKAITIDKRHKSHGDFGTVADYHMSIGKFAQEIQIERDGHEWYIRGPLGTHSRITKDAAFRALLFDYALREPQAELMVKSAEYVAHRPYKARIRMAHNLVKRANISGQLDPSALDDLGYVNPSGIFTTNREQQIQFSQPQREDIREIYGYEPGNEDYRNHASIYNNDLNAIQTASQTGSKEVLDTSVLVGLLNVHDVGEKIDKFMPALISGLDKIGRILFLLYWHWDKFEEQYGKQDTLEMEDKLKMVFEHVGELVSFLQKRSLFGDPESMGVGAI